MARSTLIFALALTALLGCARPRPAPPPPPPPAPAPEPPPPPKCDSLDEGCIATAETRSVIQTSSWTIAPPPKWKYAHEPDATVARIDTASLAVLVHETGDKKTATAKRSAALDTITHKLGVTMPKKKLVWPAKPAKVLTVESAKVSLYQFDGVTQDGQPGVLLVFTTKLPEDKSLFGAGFVLESDTTDADQGIMASLKSLRVETSPASHPPLPADAGTDSK